MSNTVSVLAAAAAVATATSGGMMFAFSTFVMRGLDRTGDAAAITAMRGINDEAKSNAVFLAVYFGAALLALAVGVLAGIQWDNPGSGWLVAGAVFGILGALVTIACNVPLNDRLDTVDVASAPDAWQAYLSSWVAWNHVRTATSLIAAALLVTGLMRR